MSPVDISLDGFINILLNKLGYTFSDKFLITKEIDLNPATHSFMSSPSFFSARCLTLSVSDNSRISPRRRATGDYYFARHRRNCTLLLSLPSISFFAAAVIKRKRERERERECSA